MPLINKNSGPTSAPTSNPESDLLFKSSLSAKYNSTMQKDEHLVVRLAILSRLLLISLIIIWRFVFPPYDSSSQLNPSCLSSPFIVGNHSYYQKTDQVLWPRIGAAIEGSIVWDSVYFVRIAECGYEYEQTYAFFPLLPLSISLLSRSVFASLIPVIGYRAVLALSGYVLNNIAFVLAAIYFHKLSLLILKNSIVSLKASILFCFNPASIFYSSIYSESLYAFFSLSGIFYLFSGSNSLAIILLGLSGATRSNGAINAGYFCFKALLQVYDAITNKKSIKAIVGGVACSICLFVPFLSFQAYGYCNICLHNSSDRLKPWCNSRVINLYSYLQSHYWSVGFLRYFQVKQLPNFLLASPILAIAIASVIYFLNLLLQTFQTFRKASDSREMISLNVNSTSKEFKENASLQRRKRGNKSKSSYMVFEMISSIKFKQGYCSVLVFPFILHLGFMTFMALFVMHVQVATRFLSSSPPIYWFVSYVVASPVKVSRRLGHIIWSYFIAYIFLGSLLFSNFYPFT